MKRRKKRPFPPSLLALCLLLSLPAACNALVSPAGAPAAEGEAGAKAPPLLFIEDGSFRVPRGVRRLAPGTDSVDTLALPEGAFPPTPEGEGTWWYMGRGPAGVMEVIFTRGRSTPLPEKGFGAEFEIVPLTHPADVHLLPGGASSAVFRFALRRSGSPFKGKARFSASRVGRLRSPETGRLLAVEDKEIASGMGRLTVDAPGWWWITARAEDAPGRSLTASLAFHVADAPGPDSFTAFTGDGVYLEGPDAVAEHLAEAEVVFIGEQHNDPVAHMLERALLEAFHRRKGKAALSLEMFERDVQEVLDGYLQGRYPERHFLAAARPWPRYATDYRPMVEYARREGLPVIAANAPRRLVNLVSREGPEALEGLPEGEKRWLPPLPYYIPTSGPYVEKLSKFFSHFLPTKKEKDAPSLPGPRRKRDWIDMGKPALERYNQALRGSTKSREDETGGRGKMPPAAMMHLAAKKGGNPSQSLWDASMAQSIARFLDAHPGFTVIQVNGAFHSDEHLGAVEQLLRYRPNTRVAVVSIVPDEAFPAFDRKKLGKLGDVVIVTDPSWQPKEEP